ncbi:MAG: hypothetical protein AAGC73_06720 [Verrucomicrobiota bacterium]
MEQQETMHPTPPSKSWWPLILTLMLLVALTIWAAQKWNVVWVERSAGLFPPELQQEYDIAELAWRYPVYRSNDSYQWVHLADSIAEGNKRALSYRSDEGPPEGRPNAWHSGLARLLHLGGALYAKAKEWPTERGIHEIAHWLGPILLLIYISAGSLCIRRLVGTTAAVIFAIMAFASPALRWDFEFSRIDHEAIFQIGMLMQLVGIYAILSSKQLHTLTWGILSGLGTASCWWVSATMQSAIGGLVALSFLICFSKRSTIHSADPIRYRNLIAGGLTTVLAATGLLLLDQKKIGLSINALHPIHLIAQVGATLFCAAFFYQDHQRRKWIWLSGLALGLTPALWLLLHGADAHVWMDPFMRRLHAHIIEFQSPLTNGLWKQWANLSTCVLIVAAVGACWGQKRERYFLLIVALGLSALALYQNRWLGLAAASGIVAIAFFIRQNIRLYGALALTPLLMLPWLKSWIQIEEKPGRFFVADMILQVGARDIHLSLSQQVEDNEKAIVAMPFAFAASAVLFDKVHPLGTFYWENREGLLEASNYFSQPSAEASPPTVADYSVVQTGRHGRPFADLVCQAYLQDPSAAEPSLAYQLSDGNYNPNQYQRVPYLGTFTPDKFEAHIYRATLN